MLEYIRTSAQSFGVKVAFGIIILVFVFWGVGNFNDRDYSNVVAVVNGEPILATEFEKAYRNAEEYILRNTPGATREMLAREHLGRRVLQELIQATLMAQEAGRAGIEITPLELRAAVGGIKTFQDDNGRFDPEAYKRVLAAQRISPAQYEKELADQLLRDKMFALITSSVWIDPQEALNRYNYLRERRVVDYLFFPAKEFLEKADIPAADIRAWYDTHIEDFAIPPKVDVTYIAVRPEALADPAKVDDTAARAWYDANRGNFEVKEQVRARHILFPVPEDADADTVNVARTKLEKAKEELAAGKSFASVADEFNGEGAAGPGGELGWISRGQTVPPFEDAVFAMTPGEVSQEVRTPYGLHLILLEEKKEQGVQPYEEVVEAARKGAAIEDAMDKLNDVLDNLVEDNILMKPMEESAAKYGLKVEKTGLMDKAAVAKTLGIKEDETAALFAAGAGAPVDSALEAGDKYIVARIAASEPASTRPFAEVESEIAKSLKETRAQELALEKANSLLENIKSMTPEKIKSDYPGLKTGIVLDREGNLPDFTANVALANAIFASRTGQWLTKAYGDADKDGKGALLVRVDKILPPEPGEFESVEEIMVNGVKRERMEAIYELFMQTLMDNSKVQITNRDLVDRVNM